MTVQIRDSDGTVRLSGDLLASNSATGYVLTQQADGTYAAAPGGGSQPGVMRVEALPFAFDTPGLEDGVTIFTPAVGERIYDAWIEVSDAFVGNAVTSLADIGAMAAGAFTPFGLIQGALGTAQDLGNLWNVGGGSIYPGAQATPWSLAAAAATAFGMVVPIRRTTTDPVKLVVSGDGTPGGGAIDATVGQGIACVLVLGVVA